MPFAINAATQYINPTKVLEYLATGRPVISTPVKDVVRQYSDLVDIVRGPEAFVEAAARAVESPDADRIERGIERAKQSSWEATVNQMQELIKEAIGQPQRRSSRKVEPMAAAELEYVYCATQGS
jgi:glycosyltransferase involved in cell wall biosynthesis